jgi:hypothetical protein
MYANRKNNHPKYAYEDAFEHDLHIDEREYIDMKRPEMYHARKYKGKYED